MKNRVLSLLLAACILLSTAFAITASADSPVLRFNENGEFTILHLTDMQDRYPANEKMMKYVDTMLKTYKPDLVVLGGDNTVGPTEIKEDAVKELTALFVENETYFTFVFGNHDHEFMGSDEADTQEEAKLYLLSLFKKYSGKYCLTYDAVPALHGVGTHNLPILASDSAKIKFNLWLFDSGSYALDENGKRLGYDCVQEDQIEWYQATSNRLDTLAGEKVNSLAFQHIVVGDVYDNLFYEAPFDMGELGRNFNGKHYSFLPKTENFTGHLLEFPCPGYYNCGQFDAMVKQGNVLAVFSGHDHVNSYETLKDGVWIINTPGATLNSYGDDLVRGSRIITIKESDTSTFESEVITMNDLAIADSDFAQSTGTSQFSARILTALGKFAQVLSKIAAPLFKVFGFIGSIA